jgi:uracil-DNA glycosylase
MDWTYWGKPIPNFGDPNAHLLIVGLAPAAHGANRTGRMFTGDRSGDWLYRSMHKAGFASQPTASHMEDGLTLIDCAITATAHCAPPDNKPETQEVTNCQPFLERTFQVLPIKVVVALGGIAWKATIEELKSLGWYEGKLPKFSHGAKVPLKDGRILIGSYHPSQQNTFTGRLTEPMLDSIFFEAKKLIAKSSS